MGKIRSPFADPKYSQVTNWLISATWGADHLGPISTKIGRVEWAHDVIILCNFGVNGFRGFRSTGGQNLPRCRECDPLSNW